MSFDSEMRNFDRVAIFADLEPEAQRLIAFASETKILRAGDILFRRGEKSDCGFIIKTGSIALDASDTGAPVKQVLGPRSLIGETALLTETERPMTAVAREPTTVMRVPRTLFHRVLREFPKSAQIIRGRLMGRLSGLMSELEHMSASQIKA